MIRTAPREQTAPPLWSRVQRWIEPWERPVWSAALALVIYAIFAIEHGSLGSATKNAYYNYLADAVLHGQLHLQLIPPDVHDLVVFQNRYYLYWPPFPALLLLPFVALFGVQFSDVAFTLGIAALNVALVAILLRQACLRRIIRLSKLQRSLLVLFFAFGTVHITLAPFGRVWFTGQLVGFGCVVLAYLAALTLQGWRSFAFTGLAIGAAVLTRNHLIFDGLWPACYLLYQHRAAGWRRVSGYVMIGLIPVLVAVGLLGLYNWVRFGSAFDNGLAYHRMHDLFAQDFQCYGAFHPHYVPTNLFYQYVAYPFPIRSTTFFGGSLFLLSPVFFGAFIGLFVGRPRWSVWTLAATIGLVAMPILLLMGTGYLQFGPRYTLDFLAPLLLLTALGVRRWPPAFLALLTAVSVVHYLIGMIYFRTVL